MEKTKMCETTYYLLSEVCTPIFWDITHNHESVFQIKYPGKHNLPTPEQGPYS